MSDLQIQIKNYLEFRKFSAQLYKYHRDIYTRCDIQADGYFNNKTSQERVPYLKL